MVDIIYFLSSIFAIDIAAYAVMSNHYHIVAHVNEARAQSWSNEEVCQLYGIHPLVERYLSGVCTTAAEIDKASVVIEKWRQRLTDIYWFMRSLNEYIARKANKEDECKGRLSDKRAAFLLPALLRTVHAGFPAHGSSLSKSSR